MIECSDVACYAMLVWILGWDTLAYGAREVEFRSGILLGLFGEAGYDLGGMHDLGIVP